MERKERTYKKYNKVNNTVNLFSNVFIKKGNKNTSENILNHLLQEFKKKRFYKKKLNQTSQITLKETIEEVSPTLKSINIPFKKGRRTWKIFRKKWRKRIKKKIKKIKKNYHYYFLIYDTQSLVKNGSRILRKNLKTKHLTKELFKTLDGKSSVLNLRKVFYNDLKKIIYEARI